MNFICELQIFHLDMADLKERKIHDLYPIPYPKVDSKGIECIDLEEEEEEDKKQEVEIINLDDSSSSSTADEPPGHESEFC